MSNNVITGGTVSIEDGNKAKEEFAPARKVRVELQFAIPEGYDAQPTLDAVAALAQSKVNELLGKAKVPSGADEAPGKIVPQPAAATHTTTGAKRGPKPKTDKEKLAVAAGVADELGGDEPLTVLDPAGVDDLIDDLFGEEPVKEAAKEITDADLNSAVQEWMAKHKPEDAPRVRALATEFGAPPLRLIPQDKRPTFLACLAKLT